MKKERKTTRTTKGNKKLDNLDRSKEAVTTITVEKEWNFQLLVTASTFLNASLNVSSVCGLVLISGVIFSFFLLFISLLLRIAINRFSSGYLLLESIRFIADPHVYVIF